MRSRSRGEVNMDKILSACLETRTALTEFVAKHECLSNKVDEVKSVVESHSTEIRALSERMVAVEAAPAQRGRGEPSHEREIG